MYIVYREIERERERTCTKSWTATQLRPEVRFVLYHYCGGIQAVDLGDVMRTRLSRSGLVGWVDVGPWGVGGVMIINSG